jgi:hypothetical protein
MDVSEKLDTIWRSCVRKKGKPEHLVLKLTPAIADSFPKDLAVKKGLDLDTLIFRINGYDILPHCLVLGAWFDRKQVQSKISNMNDQDRFAHWGLDIEAKTEMAIRLLNDLFPERKAKTKKGVPKHLDEALIILPFYSTETGLDIVAESVTGTDTPLATTLHLFCDIREKEPVNRFTKALWAKRLDLEIRI